MDDEVALPVEVPPELKRLVDADERYNKEVVQAALWREFGGERDAALDRQISYLEEKRAVVVNARDGMNEEIDEIDRELEPLYETRANRKDHVETVLEEADDRIRAEMMDPENPAVENWADKAGISPSQFLKRLREWRADDGD